MHAPSTPLLDADAGRESIHGIPFLKAARTAHTARWRAFQDSVKDLLVADTATLIARIETTADPLMLWEIHLNLEHRGIPPAYRYPKNNSTDQALFITWLADVHWHTRRYRATKDVHKNWKRLFTVVDDSWHITARNVYVFGWQLSCKPGYYATRLALDDSHRLNLMTMKTVRQAARQRQLYQVNEMRHAIASHATANAGRLSKDRRPADTTRDRCRIWKTYVIADKSPTTTACMFRAIYGEKMTRQKVQKQIAAVNQAWKEYGPEKGQK
jgi:hypothetical protein